MTKADIFSLGASIYEFMIGQDLPKNGNKWHAIRSGEALFKHSTMNYSESLKNLIKKMMDPNPCDRISANEILNHYLPSEQELEIKSQKMMITNMEKELTK